MDETVRHDTGLNRFEISVDGTRAGFVRYVDHSPGEGLTRQRIFFHTEIDEAFGGRGLAGILVAEALAATRAEGLAVVAVCPYVKKYVSTRPEYDDLVVATTREALAAIPRESRG